MNGKKDVQDFGQMFLMISKHSGQPWL